MFLRFNEISNIYSFLDKIVLILFFIDIVLIQFFIIALLNSPLTLRLEIDLHFSDIKIKYVNKKNIEKINITEIFLDIYVCNLKTFLFFNI